MYKRAFFLCLVGMALLFSARTTARADNIRIDDLFETVTVTTDGDPSKLTVLGDSAGEFLHFTFNSGVPVAPGRGGFFFATFLEHPGGEVSDQILFHLLEGNPILDVQFASDPYSLNIPTGAQNLGTIIEDGTYQHVVDYINVGSGGVIDSYFVRSDAPETVPEPVFYQMSALLTLGGLGLLRLRKRR